jgi:putative methyltransferase (TIGR04325 family)
MVFKLRERIFHAPREFSAKVFSSYQEAAIACGGFGYEQDELLDGIFQKTVLWKDALHSRGCPPLSDSATQSLAGLFLAIRRSQAGTIRVLDFGGACGAHYFLMNAVLGGVANLNWCVVETPGMVAKARALETDTLRFFEDIPSAQKALGIVDLLHSSGTLQYVPDPEGVLSEMLGVKASVVLLNRLALSGGAKSIFASQESLLSANGPGALPSRVTDRVCRYPVIYYPKTALEKAIQEEYITHCCFSGPTMDTIGGQSIFSRGYLAGRRT